MGTGKRKEEREKGKAKPLLEPQMNPLPAGRPACGRQAALRLRQKAISNLKFQISEEGKGKTSRRMT